ncbi:MAG: glucose 1-dehydrogenase [Gemmatimonadaceae bacterium]|nr:glucose 1-dehydrogenase [Gemmatimonadaceae bacterium]
MAPTAAPSFSLAGKTALITGASRGIGLAIPRMFAQAGAQVVLNARKLDVLTAAVDGIVAEGGAARALAMNAGRPEHAPALIEAAAALFGGVDILVNNAAANPIYGPVELATPEIFSKIMNVNLHAPFELAKAARPLMQARGGGSIINMSSIGGRSPEPGLGIYSVSKAALLSLTQVLAKEWGADNITVNAICPGLIKTDFSSALWSNEQTMKHMLRQQPIQRIGEGEDIAAMALHLASDAARFTTGATFTVDGGYLS